MSVTVLMSVYNGAAFLRDALESTLQQTYGDFEFLIIDDGSSDGSASILAGYAARDKRIRLISQHNQGLAASLNTGLRMANFELVARMDCDDRMLPQRLARQVVFMSAHPDVAVGCTWGNLVNAAGKVIATSCNAVDVKRGLQELNPRRFVEIIHPSVMMRRTDILAAGGYSPGYVFGEDRELWGRLVTAGYQIACQAEVLVDYRLHTATMSMHKQMRNMEICDYIDCNIVRRIDGEPDWSWQDYQQFCRQQPALRKLSRKRERAGLHYYKQATRHLGDGKKLRSAASLSLGFILRPIFVAARIREKLRR